MLKIYDIYGNQLGLIVGEYDKSLLLWLGKHSIEDIKGECIDFEQVELRCAKNFHLLTKGQKADEPRLKEALFDWWNIKFPGTDFKYHGAVIYYNLSKKDWTGIRLYENVPKGIFTLINYKYLAPKQKIPYDRGDFLQDIDDGGKYLSVVVNDHPHVVTYDRSKVWDESKKENGIYTQLSLVCGERIINKKVPYFIYTKKGDRLLMEIVKENNVPKIFANGIRYSYQTN